MKFYLDTQDREVDLDGISEDYPISGIFDKDDGQFSNSYIIENNQILQDGIQIGEIIHIANPEQMSQALGKEISEETEIVLIETSDWHIIPIENLIAKFEEMDIELIATASTPEEIELISGILEKGVDGALLRPSDEYEYRQLLEAATQQVREIELIEVEVSSVEKMGSGDRVCVDTCAILRKSEGLLVGSTAAVMVLVEAEVEESGFVSARPFRVNAGVIASYTLVENKTNYLSELKAGSTVMIVNSEGETRLEKVARVKIERRPLVLVNVKYKNRDYPIVLQDAETVKLMTPSGSTRVDEIKSGDTVLAKISDKGRHFGMEVDEFLEER